MVSATLSPIQLRSGEGPALMLKSGRTAIVSAHHAAEAESRAQRIRLKRRAKPSGYQVRRLVIVGANLSCRRFANFLRELLFGGLPHHGGTAEFFQEFANGDGADSGDFIGLGSEGARVAACPVEGDGEAVGFVADGLDEVEDRGEAIENDGLI